MELIIYDHHNRCLSINKIQYNDFLTAVGGKSFQPHELSSLSSSDSLQAGGSLSSSDSLQVGGSLSSSDSLQAGGSLSSRDSSDFVEIGSYQVIFYFLLTEYLMYNIFADGCRTKCKNIDINGKQFIKRKIRTESLLSELTRAKKNSSKNDNLFKIFIPTCKGFKYTCNPIELRQIRILFKKKKGIKLVERYSTRDSISEEEKEKRYENYKYDSSYGQDMSDIGFLKRYDCHKRLTNFNIKDVNSLPKTPAKPQEKVKPRNRTTK